MPQTRDHDSRSGDKNEWMLPNSNERPCHPLIFRPVDAGSQPRSSAMPNRMQDIVVLGGLAALFLWIYVVLPLAFFHT
jgi:hypothetical protein